MLCEDVIQEILKYCDAKTVTSFHLINRYRASKASQNLIIKNRKLLAHQLKKTKVNKRQYYKSEILDLKIGDRVTDRNYNYRVSYIDKKKGLLEQVDMYGNLINNNIVLTQVESIRKYNHSKSSKNSLFWATYHYDDENRFTYVSRLMYGIIKHDHGPIINHVDSLYLNYITLPQLTLYKHTTGEPQLNMIVTVNYKWTIYEYYINHLTKDTLYLTLISPPKDKVNPYLTSTKINNKWVIDKKYDIILFGGWINYF